MSSLRLATASNVRAFQNLAAALKTSDPKWTQAIDEGALEDEIGRFRVWAGNLGALQKGHSSLDYRLRDSPVSNTNTLKLLKELETNVNEAYAVVSGARLPFEEQPRPDMTEDDDDNDSFFSSDEDDEDSSSDEPRSELKMRFGEIVDIIDNLYKLSVRIRTPGLRSRSLKASSYTQKDPETGVDIFEMYAAQDLKHVQELVWHLRQPYEGDNTIGEQDFLIQRLSASVTLRRRHFKYWKRHRDKLSASTIFDEVQGIDATTSFERPISATNDGPQTQQVPINTVPKEAPSRKTGKTMLSGTEVTQLPQSLDDIVDATSVTSYAVTVKDVHGKGVDLPPPPKSVNADKDFECPYCWVVCPARYGKGRAWRTHLLQDLQPYSCTYPNCESSHLLFRSRREWAEHEATHRKVWRCPEHPAAVFQSQAGLENHLRQNHLDSFPESQLVTIAKVGEATTADMRAKCPICYASTETEELGDLQSHIANHLERIATFSLPLSRGDDSDGASSIASLGSSRSEYLSSSVSTDTSDIQDTRKETDNPTLQLDEPEPVGVLDPSHDRLSAENLQQLPDADKNILDVISNQLNISDSPYRRDVSHNSAMQPVLDIDSIPTLRSLYRSRRLLQLDQSYAPNDSYNRVISFCHYDLTRLKVDAIINNAPLDLKNPPVSRTLHQAIMGAGGPGLVQEARAKPKLKLGQVELTHGYDLPSSWVIHTAAPTFVNVEGVVQFTTLGDCYRSALRMAAGLGIKTVAFPCLGTGGCGFSPRQAARTALQAVREDLDARLLNPFERIIFCVKTAIDEQAYMDFFPVYFPPTHGDLDVARLLDGSANQPVLAARVLNTQVQIQKSTAALSREFGEIVPEVERDYIRLLNGIDSALTTIHQELLGSRNLEKHSKDVDLLCSVLSVLCTNITEMIESTEDAARIGATHRDISKVTHWNMLRKYGSNLETFMLDCMSFAIDLEYVMQWEQSELDISKLRLKLESYMTEEALRNDEKTPDESDEATSIQRSVPAAYNSRNLIKLHQIPSVATLYELGDIEAKQTLARPSAAFNHTVCLVRVDITKLEVDVIVNTTDGSFLGMGTLDRNIFKKGGSELQAELDEFGQCEEGDVKTTRGYRLPAKYILHAIPPEVYRKDGKNVLRNIYRSILHNATLLKAKSVAIPCIGTGTLNYPRRDCASLAMEEVRRFLQSKEQGGLEKIIFAVYSFSDEDMYKSLLPVYFPPAEETVTKASKVQFQTATKRPQIQRWICCKCGGDNSFETDVQCAHCYNHWRDEVCTVYDANSSAPDVDDSSPSTSIREPPATIEAKISILHGPEANSHPICDEWCIVQVLESSVNVYEKSRFSNDASPDHSPILSFDLVPGATRPRRTAFYKVTISNVQRTSAPPGDKISVYFQLDNNSAMTALYEAVNRALARATREQKKKEQEQKELEQQEGNVDSPPLFEGEENMTSSTDNVFIPAHEPPTVKEATVSITNLATSTTRPIEGQCFVKVARSSVHIYNKTKFLEETTPGSSLECTLNLIPGGGVLQNQNEVTLLQAQRVDAPPHGYFSLHILCNDMPDADALVAALQRAERRVPSDPSNKQGIQIDRQEAILTSHTPEKGDAEQQHQHQDLLASSPSSSSSLASRILNHLIADLHSRPTSYIGQRIDAIANAVDADPQTVLMCLRELAVQGKVHSTVGEDVWVVSGFEDKLVPVLRDDDSGDGGKKKKKEEEGGEWDKFWR